MVEHDFSKSVYDCAACRRLLKIKHDLSKSPSQCPGCREAAAIRGGYAHHGATASVHQASARQHHAQVAPVTSTSAVSHDLISVRAQDAAREAAQRMRDERAQKQKIAASWDEVIATINHRNNSPGGV